MEENSSTEVSGPQIPLEPPKRIINRRIIAASVLLVVLVIFGGVYIFTRTRANTASDTEKANTATTIEYKNPNGFQFSYPKTVNLEDSGSEVVLSGEAEMAFVVRPMDEPLSKEVDAIAENFGISQTDSAFSLHTIDSRTGFLLEYNDKDYYYFPLVGDYYLEVVSDPQNEVASELVSTMKFIPPQNALLTPGSVN